jgi:hypothetical protein
VSNRIIPLGCMVRVLPADAMVVLADALRQTGSCVAAARLLKVSFKTFYRWTLLLGRREVYELAARREHA